MLRSRPTRWRRTAALFAILAAALPASAAAQGRGEEAERYIAAAEKLIRDHDFSGKTTPHYKVRTDDPRLDAAATGSLLEEFRAWFESFWSGRRELAAADLPVHVFLFYSRAKLNKLLPLEPAPEGIERVGHYHTAYDTIALHTDTVGLADLPDVLAHEAAHQLVERRLLPGDGPRSLWLAEGLATYFGNTWRDKGGVWRETEIGGKGAPLHTGKADSSSEQRARRELRLLKSSLSKDNAPGPDFILRISDPEDFYGPDSPLHYALSWILVHYMLHADDGAHAPGFIKYLSAEADGTGGPEAFYRETGLSADPLDASFRQYARKLRAR